MKKVFAVSLLAASLLGGAAVLDAAEAERPRSMLVLDASGSMWGQIDGRPKIVIAREAVGSMLDGWQGGDLGLMAYGHTRKGDCGDIEVLQSPGPANAAAIRRQVGAINPKGMTPITAAVRQAAEQLRYTEQKATVILVSDGEETCDADPCALGKDLERMGVDFTAHVVGFDIQQGSKAYRQLQCLASSTGGRYLEARDAAGLNRALDQVAQAQPPAPPPACGQFAEGPEFAMDMDTWPTGGHASRTATRKMFDGVEMGASASARDCQKLCNDDKACTAWMFEAIGSNFRSLPVCFRWDGVAALRQPKPGHAGNAMGVKPGVRQIAVEDGAVCAEGEAAAAQASSSAPDATGGLVEEKARRQAQRQQQRAEDAADRATDRAVDKVTDRVLNRLFGD